MGKCAFLSRRCVMGGHSVGIGLTNWIAGRKQRAANSSPLEPTGSTVPTSVCAAPSVLCLGSSVCISQKQLCDGRRDCPDGSDEESCVFKCQNAGKDCQDGSDEMDCSSQIEGCHHRCDNNTRCNCNAPPAKCRDYQWPCRDGSKCIPLSWRCDGKEDCHDGTDEEKSSNQSSSLPPQVCRENAPLIFTSVAVGSVLTPAWCVTASQTVLTVQMKVWNVLVTTAPVPHLLCVTSDLLLLGVHSGSLKLLSTANRPVFSVDYDWAQRRVYWLSPTFQSIRWADMKNSNKGTLIKGTTFKA
uniref:Uncharacterized protein n=1 Tax=Oryzias latipes TaxID=8090 RepID=H2M6N9_ORYLA